MENEEKNTQENTQEIFENNINENVSEALSLEEKLKMQDEFAFLDKESTQEDVNKVKEVAITETSELKKEVKEEKKEEKKEEIPQVFKEKTIEETIENIYPEPTQIQEIVTFEDNIEEGSEEELITVRPVKFQEFEQTPPNRAVKRNLDIMQDVMLHVSVELGRTKSSIKEVMEMEKGSIVELDKIAGEQVEIFINERLVAKGEVIVIEDKFGVRVTSTNIQKQIH